MTDSFILEGVILDTAQILTKFGLNDKGEVQRYIDSEVLRLCEPYVPFDVGTLIQSGINNTVIGSGEVKYRTPYARRWYYRDANFQEAPRRGNYWFERAIHREGGKDQILAGVRNIMGGKG